MEQLKPLIDQLVKMIQQGTDIIGGQLPEVAKQILAYNAWDAHFWMMIGIWMIVLCILFFIIGVVSNTEVLAVAGFLGIALFTMIVMVNYTELKKIELAPKLYLIETLKTIVR